MEPTANKGRTVNCRERRLRGPLLASAAGHAVLLGALSLLGAAAGPGAGNAVHVILVARAQLAPSTIGAGPAIGNRSGADGSDAASKSGLLPGKAARHAATAPLERQPAASVPAEPPASPGAAASRLTEPLSAAAPEAAALSGGPVLPPFIRAGEDTVPAASPAGDGTRANGDGTGATGIVTAGMPALDGPGQPGARLREGAAGGRADDRAGRGAGTGPLLQKIRSAIVYPEEAIRRGQEGEVLLSIRIGEGGVPREIRVARSSGARTLDKAARDGVIRAAPLPSLPGWFEVPIRFSLH